jgi:tRNA threonylcarbamoyladenosine biosynthesis protein TsaE
MERKIQTLANWDNLAEELLNYLRVRNQNNRPVVLVLSGDLGAGKTTFTQALARQLGVREMVQSPTYTIMKRYETTDYDFVSLVHMDAYRIEDSSELGPLRFTEILSLPKTLLCIEWGERIKDLLPKETVFLNISHGEEEDRLVSFE